MNEKTKQYLPEVSEHVNNEEIRRLFTSMIPNIVAKKHTEICEECGARYREMEKFANGPMVC